MGLNLLSVLVKGSAYERGAQLGQKGGHLIRGNRDYYFTSWKKYGGLDEEAVYKFMRNFVEPVKNYDPEILEEIQGMADSAKLTLEDLMAINARYELAISRMGISKPAGEACTSLAATGEVTANGHTIHGQNWDFRNLERCILVEEIQDNGKPNIAGITEAGRMGILGFNSAGIGVTANGLISHRDSADHGVPYWILIRGVNNSITLDGALSRVFKAQRSLSGNMMISHEDGEVIDLEITPDNIGVMYPEEGILSHTNHFIELRHQVQDLFRTSIPDSLIRSHRAMKLLARRRGKIRVEDFKAVFTDHFSYPNSICRHADPKVDPMKGFTTISSLIYDLNTRVLHYSVENPCEHGYQTLRPKSLAPDNGKMERAVVSKSRQKRPMT